MLEVILYALPFKEPYVTARGRLEQRELLLVRLHDDGLVGLGEAAPLALRGGASLAQIAAELEALTDLEATGDLSPQARLAVELATLDLKGKAVGKQVCELLGGAPAPVRCNATLVAGEPQEVARAAREWSDRGFDTFKLKAGMKGDVKQVKAVRKAVSASARLRVDANGVWPLEKAARKLSKMAPLELAEQPVASLDEMAQLRAQVDVPLAADESVVTPDDAERAAGACDAATVKLAKVGGVGAALAIAERLPVYLSSALDGPVGIAAAAHVALAIPQAGLAHGLATSLLFGDTVAARECAVAGGYLHLTGGPGLGVEIDEHALARCRIA